jgi:transposase
MSKAQPQRVPEKSGRKRRRFTEEFKAEAVQMLLDGHAAASICQRLGLSPNLLYRWKRDAIRERGARSVWKVACASSKPSCGA